MEGGKRGGCDAVMGDVEEWPSFYTPLGPLLGPAVVAVTVSANSFVSVGDVMLEFMFVLKTMASSRNAKPD
jgi:hypothetical protein